MSSGFLSLREISAKICFNYILGAFDGEKFDKEFPLSGVHRKQFKVLQSPLSGAHSYTGKNLVFVVCRYNDRFWNSRTKNYFFFRCRLWAETHHMDDDIKEQKSHSSPLHPIAIQSFHPQATKRDKKLPNRNWNSFKVKSFEVFWFSFPSPVAPDGISFRFQWIKHECDVESLWCRFCSLAAQSGLQ